MGGIMATCELRGTLKYRDGQTNEFTVKTDKTLKSMITGIKTLNVDISGVLTDLVLKERGNNKGDIQVDDEEEDDSDGEMDEETHHKSKILSSNPGPPTKRMKT